MRTLWKGALSFGLVTVPIRLFPATDEKSISFNQLRASDHSRIGYKRVAKTDDKEVEYDDIVKGYEYESGRYVVFTPEEIDALKPASSRTVDILQFVPLEQIDPIYFQRSYYVAPDAAGAKAYGLLVQAMRDNDTVAVCKITLRDKEHLATLRLRDDLLVMETMYWPDEIRQVSLEDLDVPEIPEPRPQEVQMAKTLIQNLTEDFHPEAYRDEYRERLLEAAEAKVEGEEVTVAEEPGQPTQVVDLMEALKRSVDESKQRAKDDQSAKAPAKGKRKAAS